MSHLQRENLSCYNVYRMRVHLLLRRVYLCAATLSDGNVNKLCVSLEFSMFIIKFFNLRRVNTLYIMQDIYNNIVYNIDDE